MTGGSWDDAYREGSLPWDIGRPQPAFLHLFDQGELVEPILDSGCGTGEHALMAATIGLDVVGVDWSTTAIEHARAKARTRGIRAEFVVGDVLDLSSVERLRPPYQTVIDSGCFHTFDDADRARYVESLHAILAPGGVLHLLVFSELTPGTGGPRRVTQAELQAAFASGWRIDSIAPESFSVSTAWQGQLPAAWLARITRL